MLEAIAAEGGGGKSAHFAACTAAKCEPHAASAAIQTVDHTPQIPSDHTGTQNHKNHAISANAYKPPPSSRASSCVHRPLLAAAELQANARKIRVRPLGGTQSLFSYVVSTERCRGGSKLGAFHYALDHA
jgi:hypothetical protein